MLLQVVIIYQCANESNTDIVTTGNGPIAQGQIIQRRIALDKAPKGTDRLGSIAQGQIAQ